MSAATNAALVAAMASSPHTLIGGALVGSVLASVEDSPLIGLLVAGERAVLATSGENGAALFTNARVIVAEQAGILNKRLGVKAFGRGSVIAYAIDPDKLVTVTLFGAFGQATLIFDASFDPMLLSDWLGETLVPPATPT